VPGTVPLELSNPALQWLLQNQCKPPVNACVALHVAKLATSQTRMNLCNELAIGGTVAINQVL
jgi:hypothetical protein